MVYLNINCNFMIINFDYCLKFILYVHFLTVIQVCFTFCSEENKTVG